LANGNAATEASYDAIPYASLPVTSSHPDRLYNVAKLFGLDPTPPERARILELGCAGGGNLLPIASQFPNATCVGVELSQVQVGYAKTAIDFVGLKNISILQKSIDDITPEFGKFDYIVCHGVFSWVPDFVREAILRISAQNLSDNGVVFISYNTLPGWYTRSMLRDMMLQHVDGIKDPKVRIAQARALMKFLLDANTGSTSAHATVLRAEIAALDQQPDLYLFHEYLETFNKPYFFKDFVKEAFPHGLQFLGEANLPSMWLNNYPKHAIEKLEKIEDSVLRGHYMDCIIGRTFRETLLVSTKATINRCLNPSLTQQARYSGRFQLEEAKPTMKTGSHPIERKFQTKNGRSLSTSDRSTQLTAEILTREYPRSLSVEELCVAIETSLATESNPQSVSREQLSTALMHWSFSGWIDFQFHADRFQTKSNWKSSSNAKPTVSVWTRNQAKAGTTVTNLKHQMSRLNELQQIVVPLLDGTRDEDALTDEIGFLIRSGLYPQSSDLVNVDPNGRDAHRKIALRLLTELAELSLFVA